MYLIAALSVFVEINAIIYLPTLLYWCSHSFTIWDAKTLCFLNSVYHLGANNWFWFNWYRHLVYTYLFQSLLKWITQLLDMDGASSAMNLDTSLWCTYGGTLCGHWSKAPLGLAGSMTPTFHLIVSSFLFMGCTRWCPLAKKPFCLGQTITKPGSLSPDPVSRVSIKRCQKWKQHLELEKTSFFQSPILPYIK